MNGKRIYCPKVAFTTRSGDNVAFVSDFGASWKTFKPNQQIKVFYNPENPQQAGIKADPSASLLYPLLMIIGGLVAIGGLFFAVFEVFIYYLIFSARQ